MKLIFGILNEITLQIKNQHQRDSKKGREIERKGRAPRSKRGKYVVKTQERDQLAPFTLHKKMGPDQFF